MNQVKTFMFALPVAGDEFGKWLEENNVSVEFCVMLGNYHVTLSWKNIIRYSDARGQHSEHWTVSRHDRDFMKAMSLAVETARNEITISRARKTSA